LAARPTEAIDRWARTLGRATRPLSNRQKAKILTIFHGVMERARRVWKLSGNPVADVEKPRTAPSAGGIEVFTPEEVMALARAGEDEQDAAMFLTAGSQRSGRLGRPPICSVSEATCRSTQQPSLSACSTTDAAFRRPHATEGLARGSAYGRPCQALGLMFSPCSP
jgi:hypothetical protein